MCLVIASTWDSPRILKHLAKIGTGIHSFDRRQLPFPISDN